MKKVKVVKVYARSITILPPEDSVMKKDLKKLIKEQCTSANHGDGVGVNQEP